MTELHAATQDKIWNSYKRFLRLKKRSEVTIKSYGWSYQALATWSKRSPVDLGRADLEEFIDYRMCRVSSTTVRKNVVDLKIFYRWAVREEFISKSPMEKIPTPELDETLPTVFTENQLKALFRTCSAKDFNSRRDLAILRLLSECGSPRLGELIRMEVADVDMRSDLVRVSGKTGERFIPAGDKTLRAVELYLRLRDKHRCSDLPSLWLGKFGPIGRNGIAQILKRRGEQAGIKGVHAHLFRHTASSRANEAGLPDSLLEPLMGWIPGSKMTRLYGRSTRVRRAQQAARRLAIGDRI